MADLNARVTKDLAETHLHDFIRQAWHVVEPGSPFTDGWHLHAICEHLEACASGDIRRLIIAMPPRHGKSLLVSVFFPAWLWIRRPEVRWLYSSYAHSLAIRDSVKCRDLILSDWYQSRWRDRFQLKADQNEKLRYDTSRGGIRHATSVGGSGTGFGGDFVICDDAHNVSEAESDVERQAAIRWWDTSMSTRGNDPRTVCHIVTGQRVHQDDLIGHLIELGTYEPLILPAEFDSSRARATSIGWTDPRKEDGQLLWPERFTKEAIDGLKRQLGSQAAAAQLQQNPTPPGGSLFRSSFFRYFTVERVSAEQIATPDVAATLPKFRSKPVGERLKEVFVLDTGNGRKKRWFAWQCWFFQTIDTAMKEGRTNDYSAIATLVVTPDWEILVYDVWRDRLPVPDQYPHIRRMRSRFPQVEEQWVEDKASGTGLIQQSRKDGVPFKTLKANAGKTQRAVPILAYYEAGSVYHRHGAPWLTDLETELLSFPGGAHDDQVDTLSHAGTVVLERASKEPRIRVMDVEAAREKRAADTTAKPAKSAMDGLFVGDSPRR